MVTKIYSKNMYRFITGLCLILISLILMPNAAQGYDEDFTHVYDEAGLLTENEVQELENLSVKIGMKNGIDIVFLTQRNANNNDKFMQDFFDEYLYDQNPDSVILLVDIGSRDVIHHGYGKCETYLDSVRGDDIISQISPSLSNGNYKKAFKKYIDLVDYYMNISPPKSTSGESIGGSTGSNTITVRNQSTSVWHNILFQILISLAIGGGTVGYMVATAGGKTTVTGSTYRDKEKSNGLIGRRDIYMRTHVTKRRKPESNNSSGGGSSSSSSGRTSSGHSHSRSSGKF